MPELVKLALILGLVCLISAGALGWTYERTKPIMDKFQAEKSAKARLTVMPEGTKTVDAEEDALLLDLSKLEQGKFEALRGILNDGQEATKRLRVFRGYDGGGRVTGYAVEMGSTGFSSELALMVGVDGTKHPLAVSGTVVLSQAETPGLGAEMETVSYEDAQKAEETKVPARPAFQKQFVGKVLEQLILKKRDPKGAIDAITASTISSKAFTRAVHGAVELLDRREALLAKKGEAK